MFSKLIVSNTLSNLRNIDEKYNIGENSFQYAKKLTAENTAENTAGIIMDYNGTNINSEVRHFMKQLEDDYFTRVSGSAFCQRRQQLSPDVFKDEDEELVENVYKQLKHLHKYNGKTLLAADTSIITLSNHTLTKEKYGVQSKIDVKNVIARAIVACITDTLTNMIVSADIIIKKSSEPKIAVS